MPIKNVEVVQILPLLLNQKGKTKHFALDVAPFRILRSRRLRYQIYLQIIFGIILTFILTMNCQDLYATPANSHARAVLS